MASSSAGKKMDSSGDTPEKLLEKYKEKYTAAINIAQKAKIARDEAIKHNKMILTENDSLREKVKQLEKQYGTAEEMLGVLTDQKLKLSMEIDDLKKKNAVFIEELKTKEKAVIEAESFKRQYNRLLKENEEIINKFGSSEQEYVQLRKECDEVKKNNKALKQLYGNVQTEKEDLAKSFKETLQRLCDLEENQKSLNSALSQRFKVVVSDVKEWIEILSSKDVSSGLNLSDDERNIKAQQELESMTREKESLEQEIADLNERISSLRQELSIANSDRDQMMNNLEKVGLETKQLIENSEKLTDEIGGLKNEKDRLDCVITSLENEKGLLSRIVAENEEEINRLCLQLRESQKINQELIIKMESLENPSCFNSTTSIDEEKYLNIFPFDTELGGSVKRLHELKEKSVNRELSDLQEELQVFSSEIGKYKSIADCFKEKLEKAVGELNEKNNLLVEHEKQIESLRTKIATHEEQQISLNTNLNECKSQLLAALNDLSNAEEIKNNLNNESDLINQKLTTVLNELNEKNSIISEQSNRIKSLEEALADKNTDLEASNKLLDDYKEDANAKRNELSKLFAQTNELKISLESITEESKIKLFKYQSEISDLKKIVEKFQEQNSSLSSMNNDLQSRLEEKQSDSTAFEKDYSSLKYELSSLTEKNNSLISQNEILQTKLKEKEESLGYLEQKTVDLKSSLTDLIQQHKNSLTHHDDLNHQLEDKQTTILNLEQENSSLKSNLSNAIERNENMTSLYNELNVKIKEKEDSMSAMEQEIVSLKSDLSNVINQNKHLTSILDDLQSQLKEKQSCLADTEQENIKLKSEISIVIEKHKNLSKIYEELQSKLNEKNNVLSTSEEEILSLKEEVKRILKEKEEISSLNCSLKMKIDSLVDSDSEKYSMLVKENSELHEKLNSLVLQASERDQHITNLKSDLENIIKVRDYIEKGRDLLSQEKSHLDDLVKDAISCLFEVNNKIELDISRLRGENTPSSLAHKLEKNEVNMIIKYSEVLKENQHILSKEVTSLLEANEQLLKENTLAKTEIENLQKECSKISENLSKLRSNNTSLENMSVTFKELQEEKCKLLEQTEKLSLDNSSLNENFQELHTRFNESNAKCKAIEERLKNVESERKSERDEHDKKVKILEETLSELEKKVCILNEAEKCLIAHKTDLNKKISELNLENVSLKKQNNEYNNAIASTEKLLKDLQSSVSENEKMYHSEIEKMEQTISNYVDKLKLSDQKVTDLSVVNENLTGELNVLRNNFEVLQSKYGEEKHSILERTQKLQEELNKCNELLSFKTLELQKNNRIWAGRFSSLKIALIGLNKGRKEIKNHCESIENLFVSFMEQIKDPLQDKVNLVVQNSVSAAKIELINEMHQMNQALKERGETISRLEFEISEHQTRLKQLSTLNENTTVELLQVREELKNFQEHIKEKDLLIRQLENENEQLKEGHTADSEVLSTSTISRSEEYTRMKDVEESFEDRYAKLKLLAVKMKKRIGELTQALETERNKMATERAELQEKIAGMSLAVKNAQKLQELFDQSLDERDELKNKNKSLENSLEELKNSEENLKSKVASLEANNQNIPVMKKHIDSLNGIIKDTKAEVHKLQMENKAEVIKYEELKKVNAKLETKVEELSRSLEQAKQQGKNTNVLQLEMNNYEKIVADLSSQLNAERNVVKNLQKENEAISNMKAGLNEQIEILEKQIKVEEGRNQNTNEQLSLCRTKLEESIAQVESLNNDIEQMHKELTNEKNKTEALTLEMSHVTSEFSRKEMSMMAKISTLQEQIRSLETSLQSTKQELVTSKREIEQINEEYEGYKLRAQTILAKRKGEFVTHGEKEAKDEVERLKKDCKMLEEKLEAYTSEIETLNTRISSLTLEKARNDKKIDEMRQALQQKIADYDLINTEFYNFKMSNEAVIENLKDELFKKKQEYQSELNYQRKIIDELSSEFKYKEDAKENLQVQMKEKTDNSGIGLSFQEEGPLISEREDGEGSESVPSPITRRHSTNLVPLDILLNNPILDENKVTVLQEQVEKLQKELSTYDVRCKHLSSLLSEAERDSARNLHQNKILKEELRRLERSLERQPHVANTEYLKNIVFKFVTLPIGDERSRLVPVLDTLLKLSPEESNKLNSVARGESQAGWGSYLPSWTGL